MKLTVFYDGQFWIGVVEQKEGEAIKAVRYVFGSEPKDDEVLAFVNGPMLSLLHKCRTTTAVPLEMKKRKNPKRLQREAAKEMKTRPLSTYAQTALQLELEHRKKERKVLRKELSRSSHQAKKRVKSFKKRRQNIVEGNTELDDLLQDIRFRIF
ncbi:YjdF family protein [Aeribacillus pallidus]|uniref:YjdF family protein n=1 Tax=Aeribacillus pallidus TaxID=33936 RepID=UPI001E32FCF0|nr:YjdF family protein [Aeribacillus pallidus]